MSGIKKILISGASGLLGRQLIHDLRSNPDLDVTGLCHSRPSHDLVTLDLTDFPPTSEFIRNLKPQFVIHAAAQRFPDKVEKDFEAARLLNVEVSRHLATICKDIGARMVYISTDYVFDGSNPPYSHTTPPNPINKYGETKLDGEKAVLDVDPDHIVLRVPVLYGQVTKLNESAVTVLLDLVRGGQPSKVSSYEVRCPAHTKDIARILADLVTKQPRAEGGVYQWSGLEKLSKWDMVQIIHSETKLDISHLTEQSEASTGAIRPRDVEMERKRLEDLGIGQHTPFKQGLMEAINPFL